MRFRRFYSPDDGGGTPPQPDTTPETPETPPEEPREPPKYFSQLNPEKAQSEAYRALYPYAKIEDLRCAAALPELLDAADMIVIARGDLGNSMPLWQLPGVQKDISARCRAAGRPFLVVNQLLHNMTGHPVPTRPEVCDIFNAVADGCAALMLTGETALGQYPAQAMDTLRRTAEAALDWLAREQNRTN